MRILSIVLSAFFIFSTAHAQTGKVIYNQTRKLTIQVEGDIVSEEIRNMLPSFNEETKELVFKNQTTIYRDVTEEKTHAFSQETSEGMMNVQIKARASQEQTFFDHAKNKRVSQREIMGKLFLIEEDIEKHPWKILPEQKEIAGYTCMKASVQVDDSTYLEAWFTPQLQISAGPDIYFGLPGLILEIDENNGEVICVAKEVILSDDVEVKVPKEGEKVTWEKFDKIQEKKRKEMEEMYGGKAGNGVFIIRN